MFEGETEGQVAAIFNVNLHGVLNTIHPLLPRMRSDGQGQIAIVSSLAGYRGWAGAPAYCASKAAVKVYGESLRGSLMGTGVKVNVICPGFVRSRMTAVNQYPMPFLMDTDKAAALIAKGLARNRGRISFPAIVVFFVWIMTLLPDAVIQFLSRFMPKKQGLNQF
jgi:short-subunit dehydrogenase